MRFKTCAPVLHRLWQRDLPHCNAVSFCPKLPGLLAPGMLLVSHQHLVSSFQVDSVCYIAIGLGRIPQQRDLIAIASDKCR
jgi:hypothetical protein